MEFPKLSPIDKAFLMVLAGVLSLCIVIQAGSSFTGVDNTFAVDSVESVDGNFTGDFYLPNGRLYLRDEDIYITSLNDGYMDIAADVQIRMDGPLYGDDISFDNQLISGNSHGYFDAQNQDGSTMRFRARDTGVGLIEVARIVGAADPYFAFGGSQEYKFYESPLASFGSTVLVEGENRLRFRDSAIFFQSSYDAQLGIYSDGVIQARAETEFQVLDDDSNSFLVVRSGTDDSVLYLDSGDDGGVEQSDIIFQADRTSKWLIRKDIANHLTIYDYVKGATILTFQDNNDILLGQDLNIAGNDIQTNANNTGAIGEDAVRIASGWFTTMTAKSLVTGQVIETEISAAPWESFEAGDVVKIYDSEYFVKTDKVLDYVIGVVADNPEQVIIGYNVSWKMESENVSHSEINWELIPEEYEVPVYQEVEYLRKVMDMYGNIFEIVERFNETVMEYYIEAREFDLVNGSKGIMWFNQSRPVFETKLRYLNISTIDEIREIVYTNTTTKIPIYGKSGNPVLCVAGRAKVKISEPVFKNDILVAGPDGKARSLRSVIELAKNQYQGTPVNWNNILNLLEGLNLRTLGQVMEDSDGLTCWAMLW